MTAERHRRTAQDNSWKEPRRKRSESFTLLVHVWAGADSEAEERCGLFLVNMNGQFVYNNA